MNIANLIENTQVYKTTENDALALKDTGSDLVNLFARVGAMRKTIDELPLMFNKAMVFDKLLATKLAFYTRDIKGGLGERDAGRVMLSCIQKNYPEIFIKNMDKISEFGRWDDLVYLACSDEQNAKKEIFELLNNQLKKDIENMSNKNPISLLAKWLPSENTTSKKTRKNALLFIQEFKMTKKEYRTTLASLRAYLNVTEVNMSSKNYEKIKYEEVTSYAMNRYISAFYRHDEDRFKSYMYSIIKGEKKINASTLYPYDVIEKYFNDISCYKRKLTNEEETILEAQWNSLPDYTDENSSFLIMADVSQSMNGRPLATSVGLAMYYAQRNKGVFKDKFMTFSSKPELVSIQGKTLKEKIINMVNSDWLMNTDLEAALRLVLDTAVKFKANQNELPTSIVIISDMEIDRCAKPSNNNFYDEMKKEFESNGYNIPNIVFWNVDSRHDTYHASFNTKGVQLASGQSTRIFLNLSKGLNLTPYEYVLQTLNDERYNGITIN